MNIDRNIKRSDRSDKSMQRMVEIWEGAVRKTHLFLSDEEIESIRPEVIEALKEIEDLYCYADDEKITGFIGAENNKIEMLFIDTSVRGKGIGRKLIEFARMELNAVYVDVNEQNEQGVGFYKHLGFREMKRSELDEQGRPFPILHMEISSDIG